ncbi:MAG: VWA domain-containing protein [Planctomycetota bacterium]
MSFLRPEVLLWLPAALFVLLLSWRAVQVARRRRAELLGAQAARLAPRFSAARRLVGDGLLSGALAASLLGLSGPQLGTWLREIPLHGVDIMIVLDVSRSMLARDIAPTRLERAKREVRGLLGRLRGDRIGLITFAGDARKICPLTSDPSSFRLFLDDVDESTNALGGTAVGEGLELALASFAEDSPGARVVLLLTDGEDHSSDPPPSEVAYKALALGIPIHVVALGTAEGSEIAVPDGRGGLAVVRDAQGQPVITRPDEALLERLAGISSGAYLSAERTPFPLDEIWEKRIAMMEGVTRESATRREGVDRYQWAVGLALLLLGCRALLREGNAP